MVVTARRALTGIVFGRVSDYIFWLGQVSAAHTLQTQRMEATIAAMGRDVNIKLGELAKLLKMSGDGATLSQAEPFGSETRFHQRFGYPLPCDALWKVKDLNDQIAASAQHRDIFVHEISMKGGQKLSDAVKRVVDWILAPKVGQQINLLGSAFTTSDVADGVNLTTSRTGEVITLKNRMSFKDHLPILHKTAVGVLVNMKGYDRAEVITEFAVEKLFMKQFHGKKDQAKRQDGQGRSKKKKDGAEKQKKPANEFAALMGSTNEDTEWDAEGNSVSHSPPVGHDSEGQGFSLGSSSGVYTRTLPCE